ncbi:MAG: aldo/keto reductase [Actinomycetota bacterium]
MRYKILGKTGLKVSEIGFGALQFARLGRKDAISLVREAHSRGINLIDTAHGYPCSEEILGKAVQGIRDSLVICTKSYSTDRKEFLGQLDTSLSRMGTDYIDIFMFHDASKPEKFEKLLANGVIEALAEQKQKGKVRHIGFSCHNPDVIERYYGVADFSVILMPVNFVSVEFTRDPIYKRLVANDIGILGMKPLGGGRIDDAGISLRYIKQFSRVIPVVGTESVAELVQNIGHMESDESLSDGDWEKIESIKKKLGDKFCRGCRYCMPCPQGLDIYEFNFIKVYYDQFPIDVFLDAGRTEEMERLEQCDQCGQCEEKCPYGLDIMDMMRENRDFYMQKLREHEQAEL